jgi:hypothetical protein
MKWQVITTGEDAGLARKTITQILGRLRKQGQVEVTQQCQRFRRGHAWVNKPARYALLVA